MPASGKSFGSSLISDVNSAMVVVPKRSGSVPYETPGKQERLVLTHLERLERRSDNGNVPKPRLERLAGQARHSEIRCIDRNRNRNRNTDRNRNGARSEVETDLH